MTTKEEFQMEQFKALRAEIDNNTAEVRSLQRYSLVALAVVWSWIATNPGAPKWAAFTPLAFVVLGVVHMERVLRETRDVGLFIGGAIEPFFRDPSEANFIGWEEWLRQTKAGDRTRWFQLRVGQDAAKLHHNPLESLPVWLLWGVMTLAILGVGVLQILHPVSIIAAKH